MRKNKPQTQQRAVRVGRLDTLGGIRHELAKLYRCARRASGPEPNAQVAARLSTILALIQRSIEAHELEMRIDAIEKRLDEVHQ